MMDLTTFNRLTATYQEMAFDIACRVLCDPDVAADVVATSVSELCRSGRYLDVDHFRCRLLASVVHACGERIRSQQRAGSRACSTVEWDEISNGTAVSPTPLVPLNEALEAGLQAIEAEECIALLLHDRYGLSESEITTMTGMSPDLVRKRLLQARIGLRNYLVEHSNFPAVGVHSRNQ